MKCDDIVPKAYAGRPAEGKDRLIKVILGSVTDKHQLLGGTKLLRTKDRDGNSSHGWSNIFVTPDLTKKKGTRTELCVLNLKRGKLVTQTLSSIVVK